MLAKSLIEGCTFTNLIERARFAVRVEGVGLAMARLVGKIRCGKRENSGAGAYAAAMQP
jgi:hypothetical protein